MSCLPEALLDGDIPDFGDSLGAAERGWRPRSRPTSRGFEMDALKPYPFYKDSGKLWLGCVPKHWDFRRNGRLFAERVETGFEELPILEVSLPHRRSRSRHGKWRAQAADD